MTTTVRELMSIVARHAGDGLTPTAIPRIDMLKESETTGLLPGLYKPLACLVLQGEKRLMIGDEVLQYSGLTCFIACVELPVIGSIVTASREAPYLAVSLTFDPGIVAELLRDAPELADAPDARGFGIGPVDDELVDAWLRMMRLVDRPGDIPVLAPLLEREILYRLLQGPQNVMLRQVAGIDGSVARIRKALAWVRENYTAPFLVDDLAGIAGMSGSAFHRHFKTSTGLSPLGYQKSLRLHEARRQLLAEPGNVAATAFSVGYESASQFTREYARMFGEPPARDIKRRKAHSTRTPLS